MKNNNQCKKRINNDVETVGTKTNGNELPGAPGVKIELLPALHCPGDCITMLLDTSVSPPTAHIFTGDMCAEPALIEDVKAVMAKWKAAHPLLVPGQVSMDGTGCSRRFSSSRSSKTNRIKNIVAAMKCECHFSF